MFNCFKILLEVREHMHMYINVKNQTFSYFICACLVSVSATLISFLAAER